MQIAKLTHPGVAALADPLCYAKRVLKENIFSLSSLRGIEGAMDNLTCTLSAGNFNSEY
jgi:hypothetical protein